MNSRTAERQIKKHKLLKYTQTYSNCTQTNDSTVRHNVARSQVVARIADRTASPLGSRDVIGHVTIWFSVCHFHFLRIKLIYIGGPLEPSLYL